MTQLKIKIAAAALVLTGLCASASAADLAAPRPAPVAYPQAIAAYGFNWSGAYIGANIGGRRVDDRAVPTVGTAFNMNSSSLIGGLQAGYNFQTGAWVYGLEADLSYGDNKNTTVVGPDTFTSELDWQSSIRGRLGYAFDRLLIYGTGGVAFANLSEKSFDGVNAASSSGIRTGWTAGAGIEYAFSNSMSVRGEYLYSDFGSTAVSYAGAAGNHSHNVTSDLFRVGLNFKF